MPDPRAFQTPNVMEAPSQQTGWKSKTPQGMVRINMDLEEIVDDLLELMHSIFINFVSLFMPVLFPKIFVQPPQRL